MVYTLIWPLVCWSIRVNNSPLVLEKGMFRWFPIWKCSFNLSIVCFRMKIFLFALLALSLSYITHNDGKAIAELPFNPPVYGFEKKIRLKPSEVIQKVVVPSKCHTEEICEKKCFSLGGKYYCICVGGSYTRTTCF